MKRLTAILSASALALALCGCSIGFDTVEYIEVPHEVEKIVTVEVPHEIEKIVEVPVEVEHVTTIEVPSNYSRRERIEMNGIVIPPDFKGDFENGKTVYLFAKDTFSYLRSEPKDERSNAIGYIYYYFETELNKDDPEHILSYRISVGHTATSFGSYGNFSLVLWNGRYGWIKNTALQPFAQKTGTPYVIELPKK